MIKLIFCGIFAAGAVGLWTFGIHELHDMQSHFNSRATAVSTAAAHAHQAKVSQTEKEKWIPVDQYAEYHTVSASSAK